MVDPRRAVRDESPSPEAPREWVVANGLGGYASATLAGAITRRYHGFLIAANRLRSAAWWSSTISRSTSSSQTVAS